MKLPRLDLRRKSALVLLFLLLPLLPLAAQAPEGGETAEAEDPLADFYIETVDVNVVNVDVYVTDKDGNSVSGLTLDDFEVYEDGQPVDVSNFYAVEDGTPTHGAIPVEPETGGVPELRRTQLQELQVPEDQRLHMIVYFDNQFLKPFSRNRVTRQVRLFLHEHLGPQDEVMLVTYDKSLHVRHPFTTDRRAIADALYDIETLTAHRVAGDSERRDVLRNVEMAREQIQAESHVEFYAKRIYHELDGSIRALKELVGSLAGLPGRKALLYVTDGLPMTAAEDLFYMLDMRYGARGTGKLLSTRYTARRRFRELNNHANANRVTFYTLEAAGLRSHDSLSAEYGGRAGSQLTEGSYSEVDFVRMTNETEPLQMMALDTGGLSAFNTNNIAGALDQMARDFRNYYSLGYMPRHNNVGRYHKIEVKVKERGLKVRHRTGYRDKTAETRINEGTVATLLYGREMNPLDVELEVERAQARDDGLFLVPLLVRIPIGKVTLIPQEALHRGRLRISVAVIDDEGELSPIDQQPVPIDIPAGDLELARDKFWIYEAQLLMRPGRQKVAVGVRDDFAGETSFVRMPVTI